jgi:anti-anti-sigma regulatory factor
MAEDLQTSILESIEKTGSLAVMIDITALEMIDETLNRIEKTRQVCQV